MRKCIENAVGMLSKEGFVCANSKSLNSSKMEKLLKRGEVILRFGVVIVALVSALIVGVASETADIISISKTVDFFVLKALLYLVIADGILAGYCLLQGLRCVSGIYRGSILVSKSLAWIIFSCDQALTYMSLAAAASAAESAYLAEQGNSEFQWIDVCVFVRRFCTQMGSGIVLGFIAAAIMVVVSGISAYHLFRLYGPKCRSKNIGESNRTDI